MPPRAKSAKPRPSAGPRDRNEGIPEAEASRSYWYSRALLLGALGVSVIASMLYEFLMANRQEILRRARKRIGIRSVPEQVEVGLTEGLLVFMDQLGDALLLLRAF